MTLNSKIAPGPSSRDTLHLLILDPRPKQEREADGGAGKGLAVARMLASFRNARVLTDFPLQGKEAGKRFQEIISRQQEIRAYLDGVSTIDELPDDAELRLFGRQLFECLLPGEVRRLYDSERNTPDGRRLDIILTSMIHWVADLPWEFAYDPVQKAFLATEEINFSRNVFTATPAAEISRRSDVLRILVVAAQPVGWGKLSIEEEIELVSRGFRWLSQAGLVHFEVVRSVSPEALHKRLQVAEINDERFDVLHFIGHGEYVESEGTGSLVFEDGRGGSSCLDTDQVRQIVCRRGIRILFLNACETGTEGRSDFNRGVAQGLVAGGVPIVVGNQYKVLDPSATAFAQHFYWSLAHGASVGDAAREARIAVSYSIQGAAIDWAVPVVFAQNSREVLLQPSAARTSGPGQMTAQILATSRLERRSGSLTRRIGLWDVNSTLPQLTEIVDRLNKVQSYFAFEVTTVTAPIGTWRLRQDAEGESHRHVYADRVVAKLRRIPTEMGLHKLLCFTTFPIADKDLMGFYSWDEDPLHQIAVFSLAGFEENLLRPDLWLERAIANLVSGSLTPIDFHPPGVRTCPCCVNPELDPRYVAGPLAFCESCEEKIREQMERGDIKSGEAVAIRALLNAYPLSVDPSTSNDGHLHL